jgi:hypothetical protein
MPFRREKKPESLADRFTGLVQDANKVRHPQVKPGVLPVPESERPFDGAVLAYQLEDSWRLVTAGLARPDREGAQPEPDSSGLGIELSLRLPLGDAKQPPGWGAELLRTLADQVVAKGAAFLPGHRLENRNPLDGNPASVASCLIFVKDVDLNRVDGPTGVFQFVQAVPVTPDELARARDETNDVVIDALQKDNPELIAQLTR